MDCSLAGKVALITGGSRGIGAAIALGFAEHGADVVVTSRKLDDLEIVAGKIRNLSRRALAVPSHIGRMDDVKSLVARVNSEFGRIDILVNNAGGNPVLASFLETEERLWDSVMNLNLKGLFFLSQAAAKIMKEHGGGKIINVSSIRALKPAINQGVYDISKAGVVMATKVMARELAEYNIRVNALLPGQVHTRSGDAYFEAVPGSEAEIIKRTPLNRIAQPEEMVGAAIFMASDASSFMTGETICIHGGLLLT